MKYWPQSYQDCSVLPLSPMFYLRTVNTMPACSCTSHLICARNVVNLVWFIAMGCLWTYCMLPYIWDAHLSMNFVCAFVHKLCFRVLFLYFYSGCCPPCRDACNASAIKRLCPYGFYCDVLLADAFHASLHLGCACVPTYGLSKRPWILFAVVVPVFLLRLLFQYSIYCWCPFLFMDTPCRTSENSHCVLRSHLTHPAGPRRGPTA